MHHFDNGHLPEPDEHIIDVYVSRLQTIAVISFFVFAEVAGLAAMAFGAVALGRWLTV